MNAAALAVAFAVAAAQAGAPPEVPVLKANLGDCSAAFAVRDAAGQPVYNATIHVRVRYGAFSVKRTDLEIGTNSDGRARIEGLPNKAKPMTYDVHKDAAKAGADQDVSGNCHAMFDVVLK
jgi:hypothetical protein